MLDSETKRKINSLRDILVGKVPDPKSQIEQITTGLIYKFMYDMDEEASSFGGVGSFFVGDFEKYSWKNLFDPKLSGVDKVKLYSDAIESMYSNPTAPEIFRDIFKNAYLPFKDPATLNMFLKEINEFHYSHSEKLGDGYEYLLSFMGSQGDAGQFRTPRHIIDFMVEIVSPKKNETILDPACGSAGFLISSYKHILKSNTNKKEGDLLSAKDKKKIAQNLSGYDIDPDMARISLVNMYLHGFTSPEITEYDTLSSEDRWDDYFDVILANPPFFSPKGGIQPHSRFGVKSKRAEVLFVDYIMEHLKPNGRAGVIVPEGIIFQSGKAYKELRKKLIEDCLVGVISLPAGVFQPYSGVKTSILILDKELNQKSENIFFAKVENDGFSLGARRTPISKNDLPIVISRYTEFLSGNFSLEECIEKKSILETNDYSLSIGKYLSNSAILNSDYPIKALKDICEITMGQSPSSEFYNENGEGLEFHQGKTNFGNILLKPSGVWASQYNKVADEDSILMSVRAPVGPVNITDRKIALGRGLCGIKSNQDCDQMYLFYLLQSSKEKLTQSSHGSTFDNINRNQLLDFEIPLPPIEVQQQIIDELEGYQKIIDGCRQVVENYKPTIDIDPSWEMVELGEIYQNVTDTITPEKIDGQSQKYVGLEHIEKETGLFVSDFDGSIDNIKSNKSTFQAGDILYAKLRPNLNKVALVDFKGICSTDILVLRGADTILSEFYHAIFLSKSFNQEVMRGITGAQLPRTKFSFIQSIKVPFPPLDVQKSLVDQIRAQKCTVDGNKKLIEIYTQKIQNRINKVRGEEETITK